MTKVKLTAKHNVSIAFKDRWMEVFAGDTIYGELSNDLIVIKSQTGLETDVAIFKYEEVSNNFDITTIKG